MNHHWRHRCHRCCRRHRCCSCCCCCCHCYCCHCFFIVAFSIMSQLFIKRRRANASSLTVAMVLIQSPSHTLGLPQTLSNYGSKNMIAKQRVCIICRSVILPFFCNSIQCKGIVLEDRLLTSSNMATCAYLWWLSWQQHWLMPSSCAGSSWHPFWCYPIVADIVQASGTST